MKTLPYRESIVVLADFAKYPNTALSSTASARTDTVEMDSPSLLSRARTGKALFIQTGLVMLIMGAMPAIGASGQAIEVVSREFALSGSWSLGQDHGTYSYHSSDAPISASIHVPFGTAEAFANIRDFSLQNDAYAGLLGGISTSATASWLFHPTDTQLTVLLRWQYIYNYYPWENSLEVTLSDMTSGVNMIHLQNDYGSRQFDFRFDVDPSHLYAFSILASSQNFNFKDTKEHVDAAFLNGVPESVSTNWLLGAAITGLFALRSRWIY